MALRPWRRAPGAQLGSVATIVALLSMAGAAHWVSQASREPIGAIGEERVLTIFLDPAIPPERLPSVSDSIRVAIGAHASSLEEISPEGFLDRLAGEYPDLAAELRTLGEGSPEVFPRYLTARGRLTTKDAEASDQVAGVLDTQLSTPNQMAEAARSALAGFAWGLDALGGILAAMAWLSIALLSRLNDPYFAETQDLLRVLGAGRVERGLPRLLSSVLAGGLGGACAALLWGLAISPALRGLRALSPLFGSLSAPGPSWPIALAVIGVALGFLGGIRRVRA